MTTRCVEGWVYRGGVVFWLDRITRVLSELYLIASVTTVLVLLTAVDPNVLIFLFLASATTPFLLSRSRRRSRKHFGAGTKLGPEGELSCLNHKISMLSLENLQSGVAWMYGVN